MQEKSDFFHIFFKAVRNSAFFSGNIDRPDITLAELIDQFGFVLSVSALSKIVRFKLGFRFKKTAIVSTI